MKCFTAAAVAITAACGALESAPDASSDASSAPDTPLDSVSLEDGGTADTSDAPSPSDAPGVDVDSNVADSATPDAAACLFTGTGPYGCNKLLVDTTSVPVSCASEPSATGGTIADGYYQLTSAAYDTNTFDASCPTGVTHTGEVEFCGGTMLWLDSNQDMSTFDSTMTFVTSGITITVTPETACSGTNTSYEYSTTSTTFEIRIGKPTLVLTYTRATPPDI